MIFLSVFTESTKVVLGMASTWLLIHATNGKNAPSYNTHLKRASLSATNTPVSFCNDHP